MTGAERTQGTNTARKGGDDLSGLGMEKRRLNGEWLKSYRSQKFGRGVINPTLFPCVFVWFHCLLHFSPVNSEYGPFLRRFLRWRSFFCRAILEVAWSVLKDIWGFFRVAEIQLQRCDLWLQPSWARVAPCYDHDFHVDWSWSEDALKWDDCQGSRLVVAHISRCWQCQVRSIQNVACSKLSVIAEISTTFEATWIAF